VKGAWCSVMVKTLRY